MNRIDATIDSLPRSGDVAWLSIGRSRLVARRWPGIRRGQEVTVRIRPEDVILACGHPGPLSARNVLPGHVQALRHVPEGVYVTVRVGFPLTAIVTRGAVEELGLEEHAAVFAIVKATAIVPETPVKARLAIGLEGPFGTIPAERVAFLRTVHETGSLSAAARALGVTFRTAWSRAEAINAAWGRPLVTRVHGGKGGGGATLTPEARVLLERISEIESISL